MLPARVRTIAGWSDACILNLSSRGMMVRANLSALEGGIVELWHGDHAIPARIVWRQGTKAGLRADERIPVEEMLCGPSAPQPTNGPAAALERRKQPRTLDDSRIAARSFEFLSVGLIAAVLAFGFSFWVGEALAQPLSLISTALHS